MVARGPPLFHSCSHGKNQQILVARGPPQIISKPKICSTCWLLINYLHAIYSTPVKNISYLVHKRWKVSWLSANHSHSMVALEFMAASWAGVTPSFLAIQSSVHNSSSLLESASRCQWGGSRFLIWYCRCKLSITLNISLPLRILHVVQN